MRLLSYPLFLNLTQNCVPIGCFCQRKGSHSSYYFIARTGSFCVLKGKISLTIASIYQNHWRKKQSEKSNLLFPSIAKVEKYAFQWNRKINFKIKSKSSFDLHVSVVEDKVLNCNFDLKRCAFIREHELSSFLVFLEVFPRSELLWNFLIVYFIANNSLITILHFRNRNLSEFWFYDWSME